MKDESLSSAIKTLLSYVSPMVWIWLVLLIVGFCLLRFMFVLRRFRAKQPLLWRIIVCVLIAAMIPFPISMNNGHSEGWTFFIPLCALFSFSLKAGLIVLTVASLLVFGIWSGIIGIKNKMRGLN
jgi:hypothetical protein